MVSNKRPVEKRGGMRRPIRRHRKTPPVSYFKENRNKGLFAKRLSDYRFVIATDLEADDMLALTLFAAWIKLNRKIFEDHNNFPIYAIIIGETQNTEIKYQRATEYLWKLVDDLGWNDSEHHLYQQFISTTERIWLDSTSDRIFETEADLLEDANNDFSETEGETETESESESETEDEEKSETEDEEESKEGSETEGEELKIIELTTGIDELMKVKPDNLFYIWLKPLRFIQLFSDRPEVIKFLKGSPAVVYGSQNVETILTNEQNTEILDYLNRKSSEPALIYADSFYSLDGGNLINPTVAKNFFDILDNPTRDTFAEMLNNVMYAWNDNILNQKVEYLQTVPAFEDVDFDSYEEIQKAYNKISEKSQKKELQDDVSLVCNVLTFNNKQITYTEPLAIIAMLLASETISTTMNKAFILKKTSLKSVDKIIKMNNCNESNTHMLCYKKSNYKKACEMLNDMSHMAIKILDEE